MIVNMILLPLPDWLYLQTQPSHITPYFNLSRLENFLSPCWLVLGSRTFKTTMDVRYTGLFCRKSSASAPIDTCLGKDAGRLVHFRENVVLGSVPSGRLSGFQKVSQMSNQHHLAVHGSPHVPQK